MVSDIAPIRNQLEQRKGARNQIQADLKRIYREKKRSELRLKNYNDALVVVKEVGLKTQQQIEIHIGNLVTSALDFILPDNSYTFKMTFKERRDQIECDLMLEKDGEILDPVSSVGGGVVDVISFALRMASISILKGTIRPVLLLDEPFKHLSNDKQGKAAKMLQTLSHKLGVQVIYISQAGFTIINEEKQLLIDVINLADVCYMAKNESGKTSLVQIKDQEEGGFK